MEKKHHDQLKQHFTQGIKNQIQDKEDEKMWNKHRQEEENERYKNDLKRANNADMQRRKEIDEAKRQIFLNEIKNQENQKRKQKEFDDALSKAENEIVRRKNQEDNLRHLEGERKKKALMDDHLRHIEGQLRDFNDKKRRDLQNKKKPHGTTLVTKGDYVRYEPDLQANLDMIENKKRNAAKIANEDRKFANDIKQKNLDAIEKERQREEEKKQVYQDAIRNQHNDQMGRKQREKDRQKDEDAKWRNDIDNDNARYYQNINDMHNKKLLNYRKDLEEQKKNKDKEDKEQSDLRRELSARNRNYLIDDEWKKNIMTS